MGTYKLLLLLLHLHSRNPALEIASLLEWEHQRALIVHLGRRIINDRLSGSSITLLECSQVFRQHRIKSNRTKLLAQLAIHIKTGFLVVARNRQSYLLALLYPVVELVEIPLMGKTKLTAFRVGKIEGGVI